MKKHILAALLAGLVAGATFPAWCASTFDELQQRAKRSWNWVTAIFRATKRCRI